MGGGGGGAGGDVTETETVRRESVCLSCYTEATQSLTFLICNLLPGKFT